MLADIRFRLSDFFFRFSFRPFETRTIKNAAADRDSRPNFAYAGLNRSPETHLASVLSGTSCVSTRIKFLKTIDSFTEEFEKSDSTQNYFLTLGQKSMRDEIKRNSQNPTRFSQ